jgi:DNA repair protein RadC
MTGANKIAQGPPKTDMPAAGMFFYGAERLSDAELLAVLIGGDAPGREDILAAHGILFAEDGGLARLADLTPHELENTGMGKAAAYRLAAAAEIGKRLASLPGSKKIRIGSPDDVANVFMARMRRLKNECAQVMMLNVKSEITAVRWVSMGNLNTSLMDPREVFGLAARHGAATVVVAHNHPSGNPEPSEADKAATRRLEDTGELLGIKLIDHIIIGDGEYVSMRKSKLMGPERDKPKKAA